MWLIFGLAAIISAVCNLAFFLRKKDSSLFLFLSLSFTALTLCSLYGMDAAWVLRGDWSALEDVTPTMSQICWFLTFGSIILNGIPLLRKENR